MRRQLRFGEISQNESDLTAELVETRAVRFSSSRSEWSDASLEAVLGDGDKSLGDEPTYAAAADCLGDVLSAEIYPGSVVRTDADVVALGARGGPTPTEVLCAVYARAVLTLVKGDPAGFLSQALQRRTLSGYLGG